MNFANLNGSEHLALNDRILDAVSIAALQDIRVLISPSVNTTLRNNSSQGPEYTDAPIEIKTCSFPYP